MSNAFTRALWSGSNGGDSPCRQIRVEDSLMAHGILYGVEHAPLQPLSVVEQRHEAERDELVVEKLSNQLLRVGCWMWWR